MITTHEIPADLTQRVLRDIAGCVAPTKWHPAGTGSSKAVVLASDGWIDVGSAVRVEVLSGGEFRLVQLGPDRPLPGGVSAVTAPTYSSYAWALLDDDGQMVIPEDDEPSDPDDDAACTPGIHEIGALRARVASYAADSERLWEHSVRQGRLIDHSQGRAKQLKAELDATRAEVVRLRTALAAIVADPNASQSGYWLAKDALDAETEVANERRQREAPIVGAES